MFINNIKKNMKSISQHINENLVETKDNTSTEFLNESISDQRSWLKEKETYIKQYSQKVKSMHQKSLDAIKMIEQEFDMSSIFDSFLIADTNMSSFWLLFKSSKFPKARLYDQEIKDLEKLLKENQLVKKYFDIIDVAWQDEFKKNGSQFALRLID